METLGSHVRIGGSVTSTKTFLHPQKQSGASSETRHGVQNNVSWAEQRWDGLEEIPIQKGSIAKVAQCHGLSMGERRGDGM